MRFCDERGEYPMKFLILIAALFGAACLASAETVTVGAFSNGSLADWKEKSFKKHTFYELRKDEERNSLVLQAQTQGAASGLVRDIRIDLTRTPILNWSWKIDKPYSGIDEKTKGGDDYPVRVYVVVSKGLLGLSTRAINYVWAGRTPVGDNWPNPFTGQARMLAVDSGMAQSGKWVTHRRNVREDLRAAFDEDFTEAHAVAVMTDGDNSGQEARAWYGDIFFSDK
jgi:hypothetical protein